MAEETEELLEVPHPIPLKPELVPTFLDPSPNSPQNNPEVEQIFKPSPIRSSAQSPEPNIKRLNSDKNSDQKKSGLKLPTKFDKSHASPNLFQGGTKSNQKSSGNKSTTKLTVGKSSNKKQEHSQQNDEYFTTTNSSGTKRERLSKSNKMKTMRSPSTKLQEYLVQSPSRKQLGSPQLQDSNDTEIVIEDRLRRNDREEEMAIERINNGDENRLGSARSINIISRNQHQGGMQQSSIPAQPSLDAQSYCSVKVEEIYTQRTTRNDDSKPELNLNKALREITARTLQAFLSKRYLNFELAYLITLIAALYEDSIPMNGSQSDLVFKNNWDDIAKQLSNAARIIRSLTKLKYSVSTDSQSEFIKKLQKIQFQKRFDHLKSKFDYSQLDNQNNESQSVSVTRKDYTSAVKSLYTTLECIQDLYDKSGSSSQQQKFTGSDGDGTDFSYPGNLIPELEENKSDSNSGNRHRHRRTSSSIPRHTKIQNKVQAVKIDLQLPNNNFSSSRQQSLNQNPSAQTQKPYSTTQLSTKSYQNENNSVTASKTTTSSKAQASFTNAISNKIAQYTKIKKDHAQNQSSNSRNLVDRKSIIEPYSSDLTVYPKSPTTAKHTRKKSISGALNQQLQDRAKRQQQFQQSLQEYMTKEKQAKKQSRQSAVAISTDLLSPGSKTTTNSFLKPREQVTPQVQTSHKSFLKFVPATYHSPTAQVTFGPQQHEQLKSALNLTQLGTNDQKSRPKHNLPSSISYIKDFIQQTQQSGGKPPRQTIDIGSQNEEKMRKQMAVLMKLAEPVRTSTQNKNKKGGELDFKNL